MCNFILFLLMITSGSIGIFDSGYGGLTILKNIIEVLPQYDYMYLGDNARSPYGNRSYETVYDYTRECVKWFFDHGCNLVILACNTASAKALRTIQQIDLPLWAPEKKVLGVIRPTTELIGKLSKTKHIGILATSGTVNSNSYPIEIKKYYPEITVHQQACPLWVPLIENNEHNKPGADFFVKKYINELLSSSSQIDIALLACTHYPLLLPKIEKYLPKHVQLITQGNIVAESLQNYLKRHTEIELKCTKNASKQFFTTDSVSEFNYQAQLFFGHPINSIQIHLNSLRN